MFLIRMAFWLCVLILLLPAEGPASNPQTSTETGARLNAVRVIDAARTTVSDFAGICERSPQVCDTGEAALDTFMRKARYGAGLVYELIYGTQEPATATSPLPPDTVGQPAKWMPPAQEVMAPRSQNTLRPSDLEPEWKGPVPDRSA